MNKSLNPFGQNIAQTSIMAAPAASDQQRQIAEVQAAMMIAKMNPRNQKQAMDRILNACMRPSLAESAMYSYARGGTDISGASIRLAEAIAQQWGNIQFGIREISQTDGESTVQAYAWDMETNTRKEVVFQVPHVRYTRKGSSKLSDPRDIYEMVANNGARRLRACLLAIIPQDVVDAAVLQCEETLRANADTSPDNVLRLVNGFEKIGVTKDQIEKRIQRRIDAIQPAQIISLRKIFVSIRDGISTISDWFEEQTGNTNNTQDLNAMLQHAKQEPRQSQPKEKAKAAKPQEQQQPIEEEKDLLEDITIEPYDPQTGEVYKPNMALLDGINADGTDDDDGFPFGD